MDELILQPAMIPHLHNLTVGTRPSGPRWQRSSQRVVAGHLQDVGSGEDAVACQQPRPQPSWTPCGIRLCSTRRSDRDNRVGWPAWKILGFEEWDCVPQPAGCGPAWGGGARLFGSSAQRWGYLPHSTNKARTPCLILSYWCPWQLKTMESIPRADK